jgi:hypothetical protein
LLRRKSRNFVAEVHFDGGHSLHLISSVIDSHG